MRYPYLELGHSAHFQGGHFNDFHEFPPDLGKGQPCAPAAGWHRVIYRIGAGSYGTYCFVLALLLTLIAAFLSKVTSGAETDPGARYLTMAAQSGVSPLQKKAFQEMAKLASQGPYNSANMQFPRGSDDPSTFFRGWESSSQPMCVLYRMGVVALPALVEALDDRTPTAMRKLRLLGGPLGNPDRSKPRFWSVNEIVAVVICRIADRHFVASDGKNRADIEYIAQYPDRAPELKKAVLDWYQENAKKTPLQRKISDLNSDVKSDVNWNRWAAIEWIGNYKDKAGLKVVMDRVDALFASSRSFPSIDYELSICALTLGQVGDRPALEQVRRICAYFSSRQHGSGWPETSYLLRACHALALLGEKEEALRELNRVYDTYCTF